MISQTIEPNEDADNHNACPYGHPQFRCTADVGKLTPQAYLKPIPSIKELNENTATLEMDYVITATGDTEGYGNVSCDRILPYAIRRIAGHAT